jgi:hypothetical protein
VPERHGVVDVVGIEAAGEREGVGRRPLLGKGRT